MAVYMLQFDEPLGNPEKPYASAQFYIGFAEDRRLGKRLREHFSGRGSAITKAAKERGIGFRVAMVIEKGTPQLEKRLKRQGRYARILERFERGTLLIHPHEIGNYPLL